MTNGQVDVRTDDDVVVAHLSGDIDLANIANIGSQVLGAVSNGSLGLVVDLSSVRYLDSAGVQMLFEFTRELDAGRQAIALVVPEDSPMRTLIEITSLHQATPVCATPADAVATIRKGPPASF